MTEFDEKLRQLQAQVARQEKLRAVVNELYEQVDRLSAQERELAELRGREQADVDRLEGRTLAAFFYGLTGSKEERLEQERQEARAAAVKHDAVVRQLEDAREQLRVRRNELDSLSGCGERYQSALREKAQAVKAADPVRGAEILRLEEEIGRLDRQSVELAEAVSAGERALNRAERVLDRLNSAKGWGTWDLLGGGLLSDMAKHSELDQAQGEVEQLQIDLNHFRSELADVTIRADMRVQIDGFLRFADYFFDGLFADWAVLDRIKQAQSQVSDTRAQIANVLNRLDQMGRETEKARAECKAKLDALILQA